MRKNLFMLSCLKNIELFTESELFFQFVCGTLVFFSISLVKNKDCSLSSVRNYPHYSSDFLVSENLQIH